MDTPASLSAEDREARRLAIQAELAVEEAVQTHETAWELGRRESAALVDGATAEERAAAITAARASWWQAREDAREEARLELELEAQLAARVEAARKRRAERVGNPYGPASFGGGGGGLMAFGAPPRTRREPTVEDRLRSGERVPSQEVDDYVAARLSQAAVHSVTQVATSWRSLGRHLDRTEANRGGRG